MSSFIEGNVKAYTAIAAVTPYVLVKKSGSGVVVLDTEATDVAIGVTLANAAAGGQVPVRLLNAGGTTLIRAGATIVQNAPVRQLNTGVIDDAGTNPVVGYAEEAATAVGDIIEVRLV